MGRDNDSHTLFYVGLGALAAVGAGYLVWRYVLSDETKAQAKAVARRAVTQAGEQANHLAQKGRTMMHSASESASDAVDGAMARMR